MLRSLIQTWQSNRGNLLFTIAVCTTAVFCGLWHYKLLPEIQLQPYSVVGDEIERIPQPIMLIVTIISRDSKPIGSPKNGEVKLQNGLVALYNPIGNVTDNVEPQSKHRFQLKLGGVTSVVIDDLPSGTYAPLIYLDLDEDGMLGVDQQGKPKEPLRTASSPDKTPQSMKLEDMAILLDSGATKHLTIYF